MDTWKKFMDYEKFMYIISPIGGIGLGLLIGVYLERNVALLSGYFIVLISAILLSILSYLRKKVLLEQKK